MVCNRTHVLKARGHYMNDIDISNLTVCELGNIAAERGVSASSLLGNKRPHIVWPASY